MASFDMNFSDDFLKELFDTDDDDFFEDALKEAAPEYVDSMKNSIKAVINHDGDSELVESVKAGKPYKANDVHMINISPSGYSSNKAYYAKNSNGVKTSRKYQVSNVLKAIWKEYGIPGHQTATPFLSSARNNAETKVLNKLQDFWEKHTK